MSEGDPAEADPGDRDSLPADIDAVRRALVEWYEADHRDFPWRRTDDPYEILVSEVMSQQTQLVTIGLAVQYGAHPGIWVGEMLAIVPVSLANAYFFSTFSNTFDAVKAHLAGAALFFFFGLDTFLELATGFSVWETVVDALAAVVQSAWSAVSTVVPAVVALV